MGSGTGKICKRMLAVPVHEWTSLTCKLNVWKPEGRPVTLVLAWEVEVKVPGPLHV
jgi:hypothetical protein